MRLDALRASEFEVLEDALHSLAFAFDMTARTFPVLVALLVLASLPASARPYRSMVTRTAETTRSGNLELGLRYQGFFMLDAITGENALASSLPYHQLSPTVRFGILDNVEANLQLELLGLGMPGRSDFQVAFGDIPLGVQWTFLETSAFALGIYGRGTIPTGPSDVDWIHPGLSDGTWDAEGTLLAELRATRDLRFMFNASYLHHGVRARGPGEADDFDVPDALAASVAAAWNLDRFTLIGIEVVGRHYFQPQITPVWWDHATQVEVIPVIRREVSPGLVLEAVAGVSVTPGLWDIHQFRALVGGTYEFDLATGPDVPARRKSSSTRGKRSR